MKHVGKARQAALKLILLSLAGVIGLFILAVVGATLATLVTIGSPFLIGLWIVFALFTLYFFRDPNARVPAGAGLVVSPAHGKVDVIDEVTEAQFMGGPCRRISIFLSVISVHVQNAPLSGKLAYYKYTTGKFLSALKTESAEHNENALLGIVASEGGTKIGVRLIAGVLARRIVPFVNEGEELIRGQRISLIQFGSRTDLYLPLTATVKVKLGDKVKGGETIMAMLG